MAEIEMNTTANFLTDFELKVIGFMSRRIDHWVKDFRKTLERDSTCTDWNSQRGFGQEAVAAVKAWTTMTDLTMEFNAEKGDLKSRALIVHCCLNFDTGSAVVVKHLRRSGWYETLEQVEIHRPTASRLSIIEINSCPRATVSQLQDRTQP
jgi:hypothetical protein